jgi:hypothetical protein
MRCDEHEAAIKNRRFTRLVFRNCAKFLKKKLLVKTKIDNCNSETEENLTIIVKCLLQKYVISSQPKKILLKILYFSSKKAFKITFVFILGWFWSGLWYLDQGLVKTPKRQEFLKPKIFKKSSATFDSISRFLLVQTDFFRQLAFLKSFIQLILVFTSEGFYYSWTFGFGYEYRKGWFCHETFHENSTDILETFT